jgi:hypothetical protein
MIDHETLAKVAAGYHDLIALQNQQRETTALLLRACIARLNSNDSRRRREAIVGLTQLADMLSPKEDPNDRRIQDRDGDGTVSHLEDHPAP